MPSVRKPSHFLLRQMFIESKEVEYFRGTSLSRQKLKGRRKPRRVQVTKNSHDCQRLFGGTQIHKTLRFSRLSVDVHASNLI